MCTQIYTWIFNYMFQFSCVFPWKHPSKQQRTTVNNGFTSHHGPGGANQRLVFLCYFVLPLMGCIPLRGTVPAHVWFASWVPRQHIVIDVVRLIDPSTRKPITYLLPLQRWCVSTVIRALPPCQAWHLLLEHWHHGNAEFLDLCQETQHLEILIRIRMDATRCLD